MKRIVLFLSIIFILLSMTACSKENNNDKLTIVTTSFPCYDFARAITKNNDNVDVKMLLSPGSEMHDFEPSPKDIINIINSDMFIYVGGESDEWINDILDDINIDKIKIIKLMDLVDVVPENLVEGMEEDEHEDEIEYDEHVWTSPINAISIISKLKDEIIEIDNDNKEMYEENANNYIDNLYDVDNQIRDIVKNSKRKEIIFGDRFPLRYFVDSYGLTYYAAFPGCSEQTEASSKTIAFLIDKVKNDNIPVVFHVELSNGKIAETIAKSTNTKILEFHSAHNISLDDFKNGITYVDIMKKNIEVLKEALN